MIPAHAHVERALEVSRHWSDQAIALAPRIFAGLLVFLVFWWLARLARWFMRRLMKKRGPEGAAVLELAQSAGAIALFFLGVITALGTMGVNISALVATLGLSGFALGFALKDALASLLAGCLILLYRPFRCGDMVTISGNGQGRVSEINLRYTVLQDKGQRYLVPNSVIYTTTLCVQDAPPAAPPPAGSNRIGS